MQRKRLITLFKLLPEGLQEKILRVGIFKGIVRVVVLRRFWIRRFKSRLQTPESIKRYLREDTVYWVDPKKIVYATNREFNIYEYKSRVIGGNMDRLGDRLERGVAFVPLLHNGPLFTQLPH